MANIWDKPLNRDTLYEEQDYQQAAYRLITHQILSASDRATRKDYGIVSRNISEFEQAVHPFGIELMHDTHYQYIVARPRHVLSQQRASKEETLLLLVLAGIHHRVRFEGREEKNGETFVDLTDLQEHYEKETGREFPGPADFRALLAKFKRWGIAADEKNEEASGHRFRVRIHPAIGDLLRKEYLSYLESFRKETMDEDDAEDSVVEGENTEDGDVSA